MSWDEKWLLCSTSLPNYRGSCVPFACPWGESQVPRPGELWSCCSWIRLVLLNWRLCEINWEGRKKKSMPGFSGWKGKIATQLSTGTHFPHSSCHVLLILCLGCSSEIIKLSPMGNNYLLKIFEEKECIYNYLPFLKVKMEIIFWWGKCVWRDILTAPEHRTPWQWEPGSLSDGMRSHWVSPALRYVLSVKNGWKGFDFRANPRPPLPIEREMFIPANLHTGSAFLSSRNEEGNISNLYLSNITLLFSHSVSSLFMLRVVFVPFD